MKQIIVHDHKAEVFRTPAVLPLPGLGSIRLLSALTAERNAKVFDNEAMGLVLKVMWTKYIRHYFYVDVALYIVFYTLWILFVDMTSSTTHASYRVSKVFVFTIGVVILAINTVFAIKELVQAGWGRNWSYLQCWWNRVDFISNIMVYTTVLLTLIGGGAGHGEVRLAVVTTYFLTAKLLSYLRGFSHTGWLISVLTQNFYDVRGFVIVLIAILIGFTVAFRLLFGNTEGSCSLELDEQKKIVQDCSIDPYGNLLVALISTFEMTLLGSYDADFHTQGTYWFLSVITFVLAITVVLVVALNALIAVLSDSYSRVQQNATANLRREKAAIIVEYLMLLPKKKLEKIEANSLYFHALLEADADGDLLVSHDDWQGGLNSLRNDIDELHEFYAERTHNTIQQMKNELTLEITNIRSDTLNALSDLTKEVRQLKRIQNDGGVSFKGKKMAKAVKAVKDIGRNFNLSRLSSMQRSDAKWEVLSFDDGVEDSDKDD